MKMRLRLRFWVSCEMTYGEVGRLMVGAGGANICRGRAWSLVARAVEAMMLLESFKHGIDTPSNASTAAM